MGANPLKYHPSFIEWAFRRNLTFRKWFLICMILTSLIIFFYYTSLNFYKIEDNIIFHYSKLRSKNDEDKYLINTSKCRIPNDDPFNEDIRPFFKRESYQPCSSKPLLTYIEKKNSVMTLNVNKSLLRTYGSLRVHCCYSSVTRLENDDNKLRISECIPFEDSINMTDFIVMVKCKNLLGFQVYSNVHAIITPDTVQPKLYNSNKSNYGVIFVGIDSISKMNLYRTMPKTYKFLENHDFFSLKGYTKIGDNTFPNLMAILTGKTTTQIYDHCSPFKKEMNNCDMIWDKFNDLGYITAYAEDEASIGTFNYNRKGFASPPTDFYFRHYMLAAENLSSIRRFGMHICSGPESSGERIMNAAKDIILTFEDYPKFGLFWMNTFSHDSINLPSAMDDKVEIFLSEIYTHLKNTILIFFSDHGFRFGKIRYTHTGWLEERLPFIYVHFPETFRRQHPKEFNNFVINTKRLTTPYDMHMTLQDILLFANQSYVIKQSQACPKCQSLFKEIHEKRTCNDAAIEQHWCLCSGHSYVSPKNRIVVEVGDFIVASLNSLIHSSESGNKCAFYYISKIISAGMSELYLNEKNETVKFILVMFETRPAAMFEATVEVAVQPHVLPKFRLLGDISRINRYEDNSKCIDNSLKKYCYCDGLFTSIKSAMCNFFDCL